MNATKMHPLTKAQSDFAAHNYELVFAFLSSHKLDADEYHDAVIMHYLQAVQSYDEQPELRAEAFAVVAKRQMLDGIMHHLNAQTRRNIAETLHFRGVEREQTRRVLFLNPLAVGTRFRVCA